MRTAATRDLGPGPITSGAFIPDFAIARSHWLQASGYRLQATLPQMFHSFGVSIDAHVTNNEA